MIVDRLRQRARHVEQLAPAFTELAGTADTTLYFDGAARLMSDYRFQDVSQLNALLELLERRVSLLGLLTEALSERDIYVRIGGENEPEDYNLEPGRPIAVFTMPRRGTLPRRKRALGRRSRPSAPRAGAAGGPSPPARCPPSARRGRPRPRRRDRSSSASTLSGGPDTPSMRCNVVPSRTEINDPLMRSRDIVP